MSLYSKSEESPPQDEISRRKSTCTFLQECGIALKMPQLTIATAIVFFHKFFQRHSYDEADPIMIGTTCLFLAGKVEDSPKKLREVIEQAHKIRTGKDLDPADSIVYNRMKDAILTSELEILKTIAFDLNIDHPYKYILLFIKSINGTKPLAQVAWNFVNDSLRTTVCLRYPPKHIASAAIHLAAKYLSFNLPENPPWWKVFDCDPQVLDKIGNEILELYDQTPNVGNIRKQAPTSNLEISPQENDIFETKKAKLELPE